MKLKKLDARMNGYGDFMYSVNFTYQQRKQFAEVRQWCTETFGPSVELDIWSDGGPMTNPKWSWERGEFNKSYRCRLFIGDQQTANWFTLRWSNE